VDVKLPRTHRFIPLQDRVNLPVASTIDASGSGSRDAIKATFATPPGRRPARIELYGGAVNIRQDRSRGSTVEIRLVGSPVASSADSPSVARKKRRCRKGRNGRCKRIGFNGHCSTCSVVGGHSANSSQGTAYLVEDRCEGTLTVVRKGVVRVRDLGRRRTVAVRAGHRYLARAPARERAACLRG
jgi:hypothetical protein